MKAKTTVIMCAVVLLAAALAGAQETKKELTVEELYLRDIEFQILSEKAFSSDPELKLSVLDEIEKMIQDGQIKDRNKVEFVLEYLAMEGTARRIRENARLINYFPEVRRRAANLLGLLGGEQAKNVLITVLVIDDEPMVKAEAAYALGVIGMNDGSGAVKAILFTLEREDPSQPDNNLGYAICLALEKIAKKHGGIKEPEAYRALVRIAQGPYIRTVKQKALATLEELKKYQ
jgi:HEAT repeat protein